jgi:hypothetical protein
LRSTIYQTRAVLEVECNVSVRTTFGYLRLTVALVCTVALVFRFIWGLGSATFTASNFFAYLTIQSNIAFVVVSVLGGIYALRQPVDPRWLTTLRASVLSCTVSAGIVFAVLIQQAGARNFRIDVPWSDQILHFWLPAFAILGWIAAPGRGPGLRRALLYVLGYLVVWGGFTLVRGSVVGWYPYFFLDPAQVNGIGEFAFFCILALTLFTLVTTSVLGVSRAQPFTEREKVRAALHRRRDSAQSALTRRRDAAVTRRGKVRGSSGPSQQVRRR